MDSRDQPGETGQTTLTPRSGEYHNNVCGCLLMFLHGHRVSSTCMVYFHLSDGFFGGRPFVVGSMLD